METFPTFGYKRLTACVNRLLVDEGKPSINHKRVFRLLQSEGLMFPKPQSRLPGASRNHDGRVAVDESNKRWCFDGLEFRCNNGQKVTMTFVLDCCDREIISFLARTGRGLPSWMVQKAVSVAVERGFESETEVPKGLQLTALLMYRLRRSSCFVAWGSRIAKPRSATLSQTAWPRVL